MSKLQVQHSGSTGMDETKAQSEAEMEKLLASSSPSRHPERPARDTSVAGILRLDLSKPRRSSGSSVEFRIPSPSIQPCDSPVSPQPSVDPWFAETDEPSSNMDKVRFEPEPDHVLSDAEEEEDYSQSVSAIFQRKASTRASRKRRRSSSPMFTQDTDDNASSLRNRRRSSVFTTSSGDTAISVEDAVQEQILQNIKLHKEVLSSVKQQPWNMRRKLRLVRQAQAYIRRHEGELQERLAQGRTTRDVLARFNIVIIKHWQHTKRELANLMNVLIPWEIRIKEIESHFGSVVASYFTFLRWLFWVNLVTAVVLIVFVAVPEMLMANTKKAGMRKNMLEDEKANATNLFTLWDFDGVLKYSPLFYGYYSHKDPEDKSLAKSIGYKMPLAYFITELVVYVYSFVAILRRMAENSRQSKLSEKDDECVFTWKLFTGWDYMIGNAETAHNRTASIILGFKEALLEEAEKKRDEGRNWKVTSLRIFAHLNVLWLLGSSVYAVILVVERSTQPEAEHGWWRKNEITIVITLITSLFPVFFEALGMVEKYHPRKKLRMQLARIMALNLLNLYTLIFASFSKINEMSNTLQSLRPNNSAPLISPLPTAAHQMGGEFTESGLTLPSSRWSSHLTPETTLVCRNITVPCPSAQTIGVVTMILSLVANTTLVSPFSSSSTTEFSMSTTELSTPTESMVAPENINSNESTFLSNSFVSFDDLNNQSFDDYIVNEKLILQNTDNISTENYESTSMMNDTEITEFPETFDNSSSELYSENETSSTENYTYSENSSSTLSFAVSSPTEEVSLEELCEETVCESVPAVSANPQEETTRFIYTKGTHVTSTLKPPSLTEAETPQYTDLTSYIDTLDMETLKKLRPLCWETMFGREMVKLTVMDLVMTVVSTLMVDFFRAVFVRYMNNCWCWDLEKKFPQYGDFKMAENILHLVNNQGMVWMGMFFSPGLPLINIIKLAIMMYLRSWAVLTCNVPHEVVFRASSSNNFYLALLLTMLFLCVLPVGYAVVWVVPSWHCGPFSNYYRIYYIFTQSLKKALPYKSLHKAFDYIASPGIVIPLLILLTLIIYYLISLTTSLREANNDLKIQLRRERTEERRKMFQLVDKKRQEAENPIFKWKKAMPNFSRGKMSIADIPIDILKSSSLINGDAKYDSKHKDLIEEFVQKTKRMPSGTSEEENGLLDGGEGTDIEQHDSLPFDSSRNLQDAELHNKKEKIVKKILKERRKNKKDNKKKSSHSKSLDIKDREDSITSGWSEIPEIRIIQTESAEKLDDVENEDPEQSAVNDPKTLDVSKKSKSKEHQPASKKEKNIKSSKKVDETASLSKEMGKDHEKHLESESKNLKSVVRESDQDEEEEKTSLAETKPGRLRGKIQSGMAKTKVLKGFESPKSKPKEIIPIDKAHSKNEDSSDDVDPDEEENSEEEIESEKARSDLISNKNRSKEKNIDKSKEPNIKIRKNQTKTEDSEDSDASSQSTVKKIENVEDHEEQESTVKASSSKENNTPPENSTKKSARLRIASVLLKEAKRRSSTGADEK